MKVALGIPGAWAPKNSLKSGDADGKTDGKGYGNGNLPSTF